MNKYSRRLCGGSSPSQQTSEAVAQSCACPPPQVCRSTTSGQELTSCWSLPLRLPWSPLNTISTTDPFQSPDQTVIKRSKTNTCALLVLVIVAFERPPVKSAFIPRRSDGPLVFALLREGQQEMTLALHHELTSKSLISKSHVPFSGRMLSFVLGRVLDAA